MLMITYVFLKFSQLLLKMSSLCNGSYVCIYYVALDFFHLAYCLILNDTWKHCI